ncbi:MAG: hypothetical protein IJG62_00240 [Synergistaceae bacterium]|nr:hypothetical protein [Synergistaceae bacterium]MBQ3626819.1 hypothetical protein [Synergistaceae bacterium]MBQ4418513.1 hypothetical protein [Synergistaceae bacterium]MBQ9896594.1 hypothetical protein [Synergistaceae bacterium]MBR0044161.1 hypothetical protein [Synergistaceae bacterium]
MQKFLFALVIVFLVLCSSAYADEMRVKISVNNKVLHAVLDDNATSRAIYNKLPLKLFMQDLYSREMCYNFDESFKTENLRSDNYEVGDLIYWPPMHSFVILYRQNGEKFRRQHLGKVLSGVEIFETTGDAEVLFEAE